MTDRRPVYVQILFHFNIGKLDNLTGDSVQKCYYFPHYLGTQFIKLCLLIYLLLQLE